MKIDTAQLRSDLMNYYGTAVFNASPMAMMEVSRAQSAGESELIRMAKSAGMDLSGYREADDGIDDLDDLDEPDELDDLEYWDD